MRLMHEWGATSLIPSAEESPKSVWVTDDLAPGGLAGYYEKVLIPVQHRIVKSASMFRIDFDYRGGTYRVQSSRGTSLAINARRVAEAIETIMVWIDQGLVDIQTAFEAFRRHDTDAWWEVLQCSPTAPLEEIERAWKRLVLETHPDRGGDPEQFRRVQSAYETARAARS